MAEPTSLSNPESIPPPALHIGPSEPRRRDSALARWLYRLPVLLVLAFFLSRYIDLPHLLRTDRAVDLAALHLATLSGAPLSPTLIAHRVVVLNYWAPWCGPCRMEMPSLNALMQQSHGRVVVLGVLDDPSTAAQARLYMDANKLSYPVVQLSPALTQVFGRVRVLPTTFYLSPSGKITQAIQGITPRFLMNLYVHRAERH